MATSVPVERAAERGNVFQWPKDRKPMFFMKVKSAGAAMYPIDGVILGGTELALLLPSATVAELPAFNTTALHVDATVKRLRTEAFIHALPVWRGKIP